MCLLVVEYAIYYDYDIQHLYDLEHVWVYIGRDGEVVDAEASFHGKFLKALLRGGSNLSGTRVDLYVQPGKHALAPFPEVFELLPGFASSTQDGAGAEGLIYGDFFTAFWRPMEKLTVLSTVICKPAGSRLPCPIRAGNMRTGRNCSFLGINCSRKFLTVSDKSWRGFSSCYHPDIEQIVNMEGSIMYKQLVASNDRAAVEGLSRQVLDPTSRYYGGTIDPGTGVAWVNHTTGTPTDMCYWGAALVNPDSAFYRDELLLGRLLLATEFVLRAQHEDGSISPGWTNYHSPRIQPLSSSAMLSYTNCWRRRIGSHCNRCLIICSCFLSELFPSCLQGAVTRRITVGYCVQHWDFCMNCSDWRRLSNGRNSGWRKGWILHLMENGRSAATVFIVRSATSC